MAWFGTLIGTVGHVSPRRGSLGWRFTRGARVPCVPHASTNAVMGSAVPNGAIVKSVGWTLKRRALPVPGIKSAETRADKTADSMKDIKD